MERDEDIELEPMMMGTDDGGDGALPSPVLTAIDSLVPRGGECHPSVYVSLVEYLSRLTQLHRKVLAVDHRFEQWSKRVEYAKERMTSLAAVTGGRCGDGLPPGGMAHFRLSVSDIRASSELEAFLFAVRSALSILARVVASHVRGAEGMKSHSALSKYLAKIAPETAVTMAFRTAITGWAGDLKTRRDAAGHYFALACRSVIEVEVDENGTVRKRDVLLGIPKVSNTKSPSVWWEDVPVIGGTKLSCSGVSLPGSMAEASELYDADGKLLVRHDGPVPDAQELIDADDYVRGVAETFSSHVMEILTHLRTDHLGLDSPQSRKGGRCDESES